MSFISDDIGLFLKERLPKDLNAVWRKRIYHSHKLLRTLGYFCNLVFTWDLRVISINEGINDIRDNIVRKTLPSPPRITKRWTD